MHPRILLGCPTSEHKEYCLNEFVQAIKSLTYQNFDILLVDNSKGERYYNKIKSLGIPVIRSEYKENARDRIIIARNILRKKAIDEGHDYFFSLEQDVIPPKNIVERLLSHDKQIITGIYYKDYLIENKGIKRVLPLAYKLVDKATWKIQQYTAEEVEGNRLIDIGVSGLGCILIHRDVLQKIEFRYNPNNAAFDDMWFCMDAINTGFRIYADTSLKCTHLVKGMDWDSIKK